MQIHSYWYGKRLLDITIASCALVLLSPLLLLTAVAIRLESRGPAIFAQTRVGRHGRLFRFYKFRSMVVHAEALKPNLISENESADGVTFKMRRDPRITRVGAFIRRFSIDELPQIWNVLRGDMSIVGPRPPVPNEVAEYSYTQRKRLDALPGLTCLWQVAGRSDIPFIRQVELDLEYIHTQSLWQDLRIMLATIPAVASGRGAY
jgi:exopolysaccharide biosynthesis polyprenyl glycosylphosphotransferase